MNTSKDNLFMLNVTISLILYGVKVKSIRTNSVACKVRKSILPQEPQFVRLSLYN